MHSLQTGVGLAVKHRATTLTAQSASMKESSSRRLCAALRALSELAASPARPPALGLFELEADILDVMVNHECMRGLCRDGGFCCLLAEDSALAPRGSINCCWRCWPRPRPSPS